jgi:hypothetical protein
LNERNFRILEEEKISWNLKTSEILETLNKWNFRILEQAEFRYLEITRTSELRDLERNVLKLGYVIAEVPSCERKVRERLHHKKKFVKVWEGLRNSLNSIIRKKSWKFEKGFVIAWIPS